MLIPARASAQRTFRNIVLIVVCLASTIFPFPVASMENATELINLDLSVGGRSRLNVYFSRPSIPVVLNLQIPSVPRACVSAPSTTFPAARMADCVVRFRPCGS